MSGLIIDSLSIALDGNPIVREVALAARPGELVGVVGPNGVGKSTLIRAIAGLIPATGTITLDGVDLAKMGLRRRAGQVAYLPQGQMVHWPIDVHQLVALGRLPHLAPMARISAADRAAVDRALEQADVSALANRTARTLSGGELARVLLARALAVDARVLLADEPAAFLDPFHQLQVMELLARVAGDGRIVLAVMHDLPLAARFCDRILLMHEGRILAEGPPSEVLTPENLARAYRVEAHYGEHQEEAFVLPWRRTNDAA